MERWRRCCGYGTARAGAGGEDAPNGAANTVQVHIWRLRAALGDPDLIETTPAGYCLRVRPDELDVVRFERLVTDGRQVLADGQPEQAASMLGEALGLWHGPPLAELAGEPFAHSEIERLEEQRLAALEARVDADLACGRHSELVGELRHLMAAHPTRERLAAQLMLALYRCGRQPRRLRPTTQHGACSSPTSASNRALSCASCSRRSCAMTSRVRSVRACRMDPPGWMERSVRCLLGVRIFRGRCMAM